MFKIFSSPESDDQEKADSLKRLSKNADDTPVGHLKERWFKKLTAESFSISDLESLINIFEEKKYEEAIRYKIKPENTGAIFMKEWTIEYLNLKKS